MNLIVSALVGTIWSQEQQIATEKSFTLLGYVRVIYAMGSTTLTLYNMEIPAELAVLSACETGYGKLERGEGIMSLARAFAYAGCLSIVMSHWLVDDRASAQLMDHFYRYLSEGLPKDEALH